MRRILSWRWWFENRETGEITVAQFPNWPLFAIGAGWVVQALSGTSSTVHRVAAVAVVALWLYWGGDEVVRGVNPWRRLLGSAVIAWQLVSLARRL